MILPQTAECQAREVVLPVTRHQTQTLLSTAQRDPFHFHMMLRKHLKNKKEERYRFNMILVSSVWFLVSKNLNLLKTKDLDVKPQPRQKPAV